MSESGQAQFDYTYWAARPLFLVGDDILRFVYDPNITNVLEVTYCDFKSCNPTSPPTTYFISGNSVDCRNGLKVDILAYDSPYLRFWRLGGPPVDANGYGKIPDFEDTPTEGANTTEDMSCDSDSSTAVWTPAMSSTST
ncbi:hypothetical protein MKX03_027440 [Papaver bracteatum]|nr:hypothetical protein MKX03_027440 [Papaver bracteatum]